MGAMHYGITTQRAGTNGLSIAINRVEAVELGDPATGSTDLLYVWR